MQVDTPTFDGMVSDVEGMLGQWDALNRGLSEPEHKCFSHAQQPDDRERVKRLRRQQFKKGGR